MTDIMKYEEVTGDMCGIVGRLKEIDESYFVLRRRKSGRLELHSNAQRAVRCAPFCRTKDWTAARWNMREERGENVRNGL